MYSYPKIPTFQSPRHSMSFGYGLNQNCYMAAWPLGWLLTGFVDPGRLPRNCVAWLLL